MNRPEEGSPLAEFRGRFTKLSHNLTLCREKIWQSEGGEETKGLRYVTRP